MTTKKTIASLRAQVRVMTGIMEAFPVRHMNFGVVAEDGTWEKPFKCFDWCYACQLEKLQAEVSAARLACAELALTYGHGGSVLLYIQEGKYDEALAMIKRQRS